MPRSANWCCVCQIGSFTTVGAKCRITGRSVIGSRCVLSPGLVLDGVTIPDNTSVYRIGETWSSRPVDISTVVGGSCEYELCDELGELIVLCAPFSFQWMRLIGKLSQTQTASNFWKTSTRWEAECVNSSSAVCGSRYWVILFAQPQIALHPTCSSDPSPKLKFLLSCAEGRARYNLGSGAKYDSIHTGGELGRKWVLLNN